MAAFASMHACAFERREEGISGGSMNSRKGLVSVFLTSAILAKYPFLPQAKKHVAELGVDIKDLASLEGVVARAMERVESTFDLVSFYSQEPTKRTEIELASFPVAVLLVTGVHDRTLTERFATAEAKNVYENLLNEKDEAVLNIAKFFGWSMEDSEIQPYSYTISFIDYLRNAARGRLVHNSKWKLVNRLVHQGKTYVTVNEVCRLLQEEVRRYIEEKTHGEMPRVPQAVQDLVDEIKTKFAEMKPHLTEFDRIVRAEESEYPPCIKSLLDRVEKGQHLSHVERIALVTYLLQQGVTTEDIVNLFVNVVDFREGKTRYQVEHLAGQRGSTTQYKTYNCSTLKTHGVCANPSDPICLTIRNPLTYHLRKKSR
jgi:DNA primase large subunit